MKLYRIARLKGTSRPCRYFVLHDDNKFSMDQIQLLSHYLCHIYSRTSRSVSYPAPAYYSHLAAFRGREYILEPMYGSFIFLLKSISNIRIKIYLFSFKARELIKRRNQIASKYQKHNVFCLNHAKI